MTAIGGIKKKLLAAHRSGVENVLIPKRNERDLADIPPEVRSQMKVTLVEHVNEVLEIALGLHDAFFPALSQGSLPASVAVVPS